MQLRPRCVLALACLVLPSACATYTPRPLAPLQTATAAQPDLAALAAAAARLDHPRLRPITIDFSQPLTPEALGVIAVVSSPELKAARAKAGVADAQVFAAGLLPDPQVSLGFDKLLSGPDSYDGWSAQIGADLLAWRERRVALAGARAAREQVRLDVAWQEWQSAGQAQLLAARIAGLARVSSLAAQSSQAADAALARALAASARGDIRADEVEARRLAAADAAQKLRQAERDLAAARLDLNRLLGLPPATQLSIAAALPAPPPMDPQALFRTAQAERLDLLALQAGYASQEAAVRKAVMDQFPALQLNLTRAQDTADNQTIGPSVSFTLPVWNRNRGGIALAEATREQLRAEYSARVFAARAEIAQLVANIELARRQRDELAAQTTGLERFAAASEAAARRGDIARAAAETARQSVIDKQSAIAGLDQVITEQAAALQTTVGVSAHE